MNAGQNKGSDSSPDVSGQPPAGEEPDWFDVQRVAHLTGSTPRTVRRWCSQEKVVARKRKGKWEIRADTLPRSKRTGEPESTPPDRTTGELTDRVSALSQRVGYLESKLEEAKRKLPPGEEERVSRMEKVLTKIAYTPFARYLIPRDLREELTE